MLGLVLPGCSAPTGRTRFPFLSLLSVKEPWTLPVFPWCAFRFAAAAYLFMAFLSPRNIGAGPSSLCIQLSRDVLSSAGKAIFHCTSWAMRFDGGSPTYNRLVTGISFHPDRFSSLAYLSDAFCREGSPFMPFECTTRHLAAHMPASIASRTTWAWNVRTFFSGSPRWRMPRSKFFGGTHLGPLRRPHL